MLPLSAIDAIGPAWAHTRRLLWDKRDWRTILKIGVIASFAGIGGISTGGGSFPNNMGNFGNMGNSGHPATWPGTESISSILAAIAAIAIFVFVAFFIVFVIMIYISSRLKFVLFEVVLRSDTTVGPIWRRYGAATWRWVGLRLILIAASLLCMAPVLIPAVVQFIHLLKQGSQPSNVGLLFATFFGLFAMVLLVAIVFGIINILMHDFGLPSMALESTSIGESAARVWRLLKAEPGQTALFLLMRFVLGIAGAWCANIAIAIGAMIAMIPFGIIGVLDYFVFHSTGTAGKVVMVAIWGLLALFFIALIFIASFMLIGYLITFIQAYALYFLGGRYPLLGQYLAPYWPQTHLPAVPPPPAYEPPPTPPAPPAFDLPTA